MNFSRQHNYFGRGGLFFLFLLFFSFSLLPAVYGGSGGNLLQNPFFEDWGDTQPNHWEGSHSFETNWHQDADALVGDYSVRVDGGSERTLEQTDGLTEVSTKYHASVWVKGTGTVELGIEYPSGHTNWSDPIELDNETNWIEVTNEATTTGTEGDDGGVEIKTTDDGGDGIENTLYIGAAWLGMEESPASWRYPGFLEAKEVKLSGETFIRTFGDTHAEEWAAAIDADVDDVEIIFELSDFEETDIVSVEPGDIDDLLAGNLVSTTEGGEATVEITFDSGIERTGELKASIDADSEGVFESDSDALEIEVNTTEREEYTLTIEQPAGGRLYVEEEIISDTTVYEGTELQLEAVADRDYSFQEWTGDVENLDDPGARETKITMWADAVLSADFTSQIYAYPNPFHPVRGEEARFVVPEISERITIFDVRGRLIRELEGQDSDGISWDGRNDSGRSVSSGTYIFVVEGRNNVLGRDSVTLLR